MHIEVAQLSGETDPFNVLILVQSEPLSFMHGEPYSKVIDIAIAEARRHKPSDNHWFSESGIDVMLQASIRECAPQSHWNIVAVEEILVRVEGGMLTGCCHIVRGKQGLVVGDDSLHSSRTGCRQNFFFNG